MFVELREHCPIHAFLNDTYTFMLVDTGSVQSIVNAGCHETLLYTNTMAPFSTELRGANSKPLTVLEQTTIELKIYSVVFKMKAFVAKDIIYPLVYGKDLLEENKAMTNFGTKELQLATPSNSCRTNNSAINQIQITTPGKVETPSEAETIVTVNCSLPKSGKHMFEPSNNLIDDYVIHYSRTIFQGENGKLMNHFLNPNIEAFMTSKRFHIGATEPLQEESIVDIVTDNYEEGKIPSLTESKII